MVHAVVRLIYITFSAAIGCFLVLFALRQIGASTPYAPPHYSLFNRPTFLIAHGGNPDLGPESSREAFQAAVDKNWMPGADLQLTQDGQWVIYGHELLEQQTESKGLVSFQTLKSFQSLNLDHKEHRWPGHKFPPMTLQQFVEAFPNTPFLLNILVRYPEKIHELVPVLQSLNIEPRVILQSPFASALRELRKELPQWIYGIDPSTVTRFLLMKSLFIETFADLKADVFIAEAKSQGQYIFDERLLAELKRRHKKIVPILQPPLDEKLQDLMSKTDGFMTKRPSGFTP